jgi:sulfatase modifying factor 1
MTYTVPMTSRRSLQHRGNCQSASLFTIASAAIVTAAFVCWFATPVRAVTIDWVTVGDPGNAADFNSLGAVAESFLVGKYEVTIAQYTQFLNAAAKSDPYSLYSPSMASNLNSAGIARTGVAGSYTYSIVGPAGATPSGANSPGNRPVTFVTWFDAARFANWMHNGQLSGTASAMSTEFGAYTLIVGQTSGTAPARNPDAKFFIPTLDQWYKAAYYKGGSTNAGYWKYPTQSDQRPGNIVGSGLNQANYRIDSTLILSVTQSNVISSGQNYLTNVGAFSNSPGPYGTFDQGGNVWEWNDLSGSPSVMRGFRGGGWGRIGLDDLETSQFIEISTHANGSAYGFRLARPLSGPSGVPEIDPSSLHVVAALLAGVLALKERRRFAR